MISAKRAIAIFEQTNPHLTVLECAVYDGIDYLVSATKNPNVTSYDTPYFLIDGDNGKIENFDPLPNIVKFREAFRDHKVYSI